MPEMVCIACPIGCRLTVEKTGEEEVSVQGNKCSKGEVYGREEVLSPKRVVTAVVRTDSERYPCIPVRTDKTLRKDLISVLLTELYGRKVRLPAARGGLLIKDFKATGVNVVFTRTLPPDEVPPVG